MVAVNLDGFGFSQSGTLNFTNSIGANGTLKIIAGDNFDADVGDEFQIITTSGLNGPGFPIENDAMAQSLTQGFEFDVIYEATSVTIVVEEIYLRGDVNTDGFLSLLDVAPFVDLITNGVSQREADLNGDGVVNLLDVSDFVTLLTGG